MGLYLNEIAKSITDVTSSSRYTEKMQWLDTKAAYTYQIQVQVPEYLMNSVRAVEIRVTGKGQMRPVLSDVATDQPWIRCPGNTIDRSAALFYSQRQYQSEGPWCGD